MAYYSATSYAIAIAIAAALVSGLDACVGAGDLVWG